MIIRYSDKSRELELQATKQELDELSTKLTEDGAVIECGSSDIAVSPYTRFLSSILVKAVPAHKAELQVSEGETLVISGDQQKLSILAKSISSIGREFLKGEHAHIEYYEGDSCLSPSSIPLVIVHL
jgi:hypothetical protein